MQTIGGIPRDKFLAVAEEVMANFLALPENSNPDDTGVFMAVLEKSGSKMLFVNELGTCALEWAEKCFGYCQEKATRLFSHKEEGHVSSWQSRDPENHQYGGAITAPANGVGYRGGRELIGAISGLVEHGDEAVALVIWERCGWISVSEAMEVVKISKNPFFEPLMHSCKDLSIYRVSEIHLR